MAALRRLTTAPLLRRMGFHQSRSYGAAALQVDYEEEEEYGIAGNGPVTEMGASAPERGVQWVFMGSPAAKKRVYAQRLSKLLEVPYISMGGLVRQELDPRSSLYKQIVNAVNQGKLVPEDIIFGLLSKRLEDGYCKGETGFILDGIPRTRYQAEILDQIADIDLVVNFKCTEDCLMNKQFGGVLCSHCKETLGVGKWSSSNLPLQLQQSPLKPANKGNAQMEKLKIYTEQKKPLEDYYRKQKKLIDFQLASGPADTWQGLLAALHLQHMNAAIHSSPKLTT
ncbi:hypothetical protein Sjap_023335 [Stephania japonica]|uniref:adenylate kinase n=1 Tax=Stephania japonica TaxID=461633 RepID=A0AAP0EIN5_9MAGN